MSLLSRLFVFLDPCGFSFCYRILRFPLRYTWLISLYSHQILNLFQFLSFFLPDFKKIGIKTNHIAESGLEIFIEIKLHQKSLLQFIHCSQKRLKYTLKVLKSSPEDPKSSQKYSKALTKHSTSQVFPIFQVCFNSFSNLNPTI